MKAHKKPFTRRLTNMLSKPQSLVILITLILISPAIFAGATETVDYYFKWLK